MNSGQWNNWCNATSSKQHYIHEDVQNIQETLDVFKKQQRRMLGLVIGLIIGLVIVNGILLFYR